MPFPLSWAPTFKNTKIMKTLTDLNKLKNLPTDDLRIPSYQHMVCDLILCNRDNVAYENWWEDVTEEPSAYPYTAEELGLFLAQIDKL